MSELVPTCVWRISPTLVVTLDDRFGEPVDAYVNGSQVWLRDDGPGGATLEWRLHPVAGFERPATLNTYDLFSTIALAVARGDEPAAPVEALWDGLEAFAAYEDELVPHCSVPAGGSGSASSANHPTSVHSWGCAASSPPTARQWKISE